MDKLIDLIKWVDSGFKLFALILIGLLVGAGWLIHDNKKLITKFIGSSHPDILEVRKLESISKKLLSDIDALGLVVHKADASKNERITVLALNRNGTRFTPVEGYITSLFNSGQNNRNNAAMTMLRGEVYCAPFKSSSKVGKWMDSIKVKYMCRVAIPPAAGHFHGYMSVGFNKEPSDIETVKTRIVIAATEMAE